MEPKTNGKSVSYWVNFIAGGCVAIVLAISFGEILEWFGMDKYGVGIFSGYALCLVQNEMDKYFDKKEKTNDEARTRESNS